MVVAALVGAINGVAVLCCGLPWIFAYGLLGLAVPAIVIDGRGPFGALGRSITLSGRIGMRAAWIRLLGYLGWLAIRAALGIGGLKALELVLPTGSAWVTAAAYLVWIAVNTVAYPTLACLDATLHLETRMRTEGLDIVAFRAHRQGQPIPLSVPGTGRAGGPR